MATAEETAHGRGRAGKRERSAERSDRSGKILGGAFGRSAASERGWDECDPRHVLWVLVAISALGGAVTYGRSRDRAALSVTLLLEGERETVWIAPEDVIEDKLAQIANKLEALR